jgi:hypothetical protein
MTHEVEINKDNCMNLYFDDLGQISYTRLIDHKIYNVTTKTDDLVKVLSNLSKMSDDDFKLVAQLSINSAVVAD